MSFFLVLGLVLILDLMFSSANILNALSVVTNLGKDDIGNDSAKNHQEILTRKVYDGIYKFMDPYVVYEWISIYIMDNENIKYHLILSLSIIVQMLMLDTEAMASDSMLEYKPH